MKIDPENLRGNTNFKQPYLEFGSEYYRLKRSFKAGNSMTFLEGNSKHVFDIPPIVLEKFEKGEIARIRLIWLIVNNIETPATGPCAVAPVDRDNYN